MSNHNHTGVYQPIGNYVTTDKTKNIEWYGAFTYDDTDYLAAFNKDGTKLKTLDKYYFALYNHTHDDRYYTETEINNLILDKLYPVGSIYLETTNTNPSSKLGGTWVAYGTSDSYLRLGGNGSGGSNSYTLTSSNIPSHSHSIPSLSGVANDGGSHTHYIGAVKGYGGGNTNTASEGSGTNWANSINTNEGGAHSHTVKTNASTTGTYGSASATSINITPKYVQVYAWKRTA